MSRLFTTDTADANNLISGIDTGVLTMVVWVYVITTPLSASEVIFGTAAQIAGGQSAGQINMQDPTVAGFRPHFSYRWSTNFGEWVADDDFSLNAWHHIAATYDGGATTNNPIIYVDGSSVAITELKTPAGTLKTGLDSARFGKNVGSGQPVAGARMAEAAVWGSILKANQILSMASGVSPIRFTPQAYWPMYGGASPEPDLAGGGAPLTITGTVIALHPPIAPPFGFDDYAFATVIAAVTVPDDTLAPTMQMANSGGMIGAVNV
ncbi:hypothetical protein LCGC14_2322090 [marine sediment metagenome]|uniref:LamG-like jellyroll fold domain-containing protein n=1 Tax=marine sediment metagenome TaxID=412755 RepID=A0A0F9D537_9ZZZZ|nr:hypothetical protein [Candidatus Scalindua sp.]